MSPFLLSCLSALISDFISLLRMSPYGSVRKLTILILKVFCSRFRWREPGGLRFIPEKRTKGRKRAITQRKRDDIATRYLTGRAAYLTDLFNRDRCRVRYGNSGNAVLRVSIYQFVGISQIDKGVALGVDHADDMQALE